MKKLLFGLLAMVGLSSCAEAFPIVGYVLNSTTSVQSGGFSTQTGQVAAFTDTGLSANQCVQTTTGGLLTTSGALCGSGSGGSSALATAIGGTSGFSTLISSPTAAVTMDSNTFNGQFVAGATAYYSLKNSSVTLQGQNVIKLTSALQSNSTFYVSSGTVSGTMYAQAYGLTNGTGLLQSVVGSMGIFGQNADIYLNPGSGFSTVIAQGSTVAWVANGAATGRVGFVAPSTSVVSTPLIFTLPFKDGTAGQVLQTDGARNLSFGSVASLASSNTWTAAQTFTSSITAAGFSDTAHLNIRGSIPSVSSCGATPGITTGSTDNVGQITEGTGSPTGCTITFATAWTNTPFCIAQTTSTVTTAAVTAVSNSQFTITTSVAIPSDTITYWCVGKD